MPTLPLTHAPPEAADPGGRPCGAGARFTSRLQAAGAFVVRHLPSTWPRRILLWQPPPWRCSCPSCPVQSSITSTLIEPGYRTSSFGFDDLIQGRISVRSTLDERVQTILNEALETGLALYEHQHSKSKGLGPGICGGFA